MNEILKKINVKLKRRGSKSETNLGSAIGSGFKLDLGLGFVLAKAKYHVFLTLFLVLVISLTWFYQTKKDGLYDLKQMEFQRYSTPLFYTQTGQANLVTKKARILLFTTGEEVGTPRRGDYLASLDRNLGKLYLVDQERGERKLLAENVNHFKWLNSGKGLFYFKQTGIHKGEKIGDYFYYDVLTKENYRLGSQIFQNGFVFSATGDTVLYKQRQEMAQAPDLTADLTWVQHDLSNDRKTYFTQHAVDMMPLHLAHQGRASLFLYKNPQSGELQLLYYTGKQREPFVQILSKSEMILRYLHLFSDPAGEKGMIQFENQIWTFDSSTPKLQLETTVPIQLQVDTSRVFQSNYIEKFGIATHNWQFESEEDLPWFGKVLADSTLNATATKTESETKTKMETKTEREKMTSKWYIHPFTSALFTHEPGFWNLAPSDKSVENLQFIAQNLAISLVGQKPYLFHFKADGKVEERQLPLNSSAAIDQLWLDKKAENVFWSSNNDIYSCSKKDLREFEREKSGQASTLGQLILSNWAKDKKENILFAADTRSFYFLNTKSEFCYASFVPEKRKWERKVLASDVAAFIGIDLPSRRFILARNVRAKEGEQTVCEILLLNGEELTTINTSTYYPLPYFYFNFLQS